MKVKYSLRHLDIEIMNRQHFCPYLNMLSSCRELSGLVKVCRTGSMKRKGDLLVRALSWELKDQCSGPNSIKDIVFDLEQVTWGLIFKSGAPTNFNWNFRCTLLLKIRLISHASVSQFIKGG